MAEWEHSGVDHSATHGERHGTERELAIDVCLHHISTGVEPGREAQFSNRCGSQSMPLQNWPRRCEFTSRDCADSKLIHERSSGRIYSVHLAKGGDNQVKLTWSPTARRRRVGVLAGLMLCSTTWLELTPRRAATTLARLCCMLMKPALPGDIRPAWTACLSLQCPETRP